MTFSEGRINEKDTNYIADYELRCSDYYERSPLAYLHALYIVRYM